ncbi:MAG: hypothetical protein Q9227_005460 [Pyrenula ochraceoflavens]
MPGRGMGERLAVDPKLNSVIYFGARSGNGLWRSTNSGAQWSKVTNFPDAGTYVADSTDTSGYNSDIQGIAWVTFDTNSTTTSGKTSRIFVGVADKGNSVYVSNDAGSTWSAVAGQPTGYLPHKGRIAAKERALYVTYSDGSGPYDGTAGAVYRYDIAANTWKDISPVAASTNPGYGYGGLSVDTQKPGTLMVAALNEWWPDANIWRSNNSGASWSPIWEFTSYPDENFYYSMDNTNAPWISNEKSVNNKNIGWMIEALEIDPFDSNHMLYGTGETVVGTHNLVDWDTKHNISLKILARGIEETSVQALIAPPGGSAPLLSAMGDVGGFRHTSLTQAPTSWYTNPVYGTTSDIDFAGSNTKQIVRVGNSGTDGNPQVALSYDEGATWSADSGAPTTYYGGKVALSAQGTTVLWSSASNGVLVSKNQASFSAVSSLSSGAAIAADRKNDTVFYAGSGGSIYRSANSGASFAKTVSLGSSTTVNNIETNPSVAGDLWVSTDKGLFHSTTSGTNFTQITGPAQGWSFALGKSTANTYGWNIFGFFTINGANALYESKDIGKTWTMISDSKHGFGSASSNPVAASADTEGTVYIGTNGRGVFVGTP